MKVEKRDMTHNIYLVCHKFPKHKNIHYQRLVRYTWLRREERLEVTQLIVTSLSVHQLGSKYSNLEIET